MAFIFISCVSCTGSSEACSHFLCPTGGYCVENSAGNPSCHCPLCGGEWDPVCGSDGVTYTNPCRLRYESCRHNKSLSVVYKGLCSKSITKSSNQTRVIDQSDNGIDKKKRGRNEKSVDTHGDQLIVDQTRFLTVDLLSLFSL